MDNQATQSAGDDKVVQVGKYKVKVLRDTCIGAAPCVAIAAGTFELDGESKAVVKENINPDSADPEETILLAAQACPARAIVITDAQTGEQVWPV